VAFESEYCVVTHHAFPVVRNLEQSPPTSFDLDRDARRAGIDRVLDQFFGDGRRALNHLARGDLVGDVICEDADF
jgi:hypothetical protein